MTKKQYGETVAVAVTGSPLWTQWGKGLLNLSAPTKTFSLRLALMLQRSPVKLTHAAVPHVCQPTSGGKGRAGHLERRGLGPPSPGMSPAPEPLSLSLQFCKAFQSQPTADQAIAPPPPHPGTVFGPTIDKSCALVFSQSGTLGENRLWVTASHGQHPGIKK